MATGGFCEGNTGVWEMGGGGFCCWVGEGEIGVLIGVWETGGEGGLESECTIVSAGEEIGEGV